MGGDFLSRLGHHPCMADLRDGNLADEQVADLLAAELPPAVRIAVSAALRPLLVKAARRERARCATMVSAASAGHEAQAAALEGRLRAMAALGQPVDQVLGQQTLAAHGARVLAAAAKIIRLQPGQCPKCHGLRQVASGMLGADGKPSLAPCPACAAPEASVSELPAPAPSAG